MALMEMRDISFSYPEESKKALENINLSIEQGEFIIIGGPTGCGKTTLLKLLKREVTPVGEISGSILYKNQHLQKISEQELYKEVGYVFQNPENQIVMEDVLSELVFGLENQGLQTERMKQRVAELVHFFGIEDLLHRKTISLSGGELQRINVTSILLLRPNILLLDEPTSQLDPVQANDFLQFLKRINEEFGITIILVEHRLEELFSIADRVILLSHGKVKYDGSPKQVIHQVWQDQGVGFLPYLPSLSKLYLTMNVDKNETEEIPISMKEAQKWLNNLNIDENRQEGIEENEEETKKIIEEIDEENKYVLDKECKEKKNFSLNIKNIYFKYKKDAPFILKNLSLEISDGDYLAIVGGNGSGKTTLLKCCLGINKPYKGKILMENRKLSSIKKERLATSIGYLPQNPLLSFMAETLHEELVHVTTVLEVENMDEQIKGITKELGIQHILNKHIHDCSGGEQQKAALAVILFQRPKIILLDEPTKGMDPLSKQNFALLLNKLHQSGFTMVMVTHDIHFVAEHVKRCAWLFDGEITSVGTTENVLKGNYFYSTMLNKATREANVPEVLTLEEANRKWKTPAQFY